MVEDRPRVAVVGRFYNKQGGVSNVMAQIAERLARQGEFDITVLSNEFLDVDLEARLQMTHVPMTQRPAWRQIPTFARNARRLLDRGGYDLVHAHDPQVAGADLYTAHSCFADYIGARRATAGRMRAAASRVYPPHVSRLRSESQAYGNEHSDVIAVSESVARSVTALHERQRPATHIYNGVDSARFLRVAREAALDWLQSRVGPPSAKHELTMVFVGYEFDRKRLGVAIEVVARLGSAVRLLVAGRGPIREYRALSERLGVAERVHFLGHVPDVEYVLRAGDVFLFPTRYEAASLAILEALTSGLAVVTTDVAMAREVLTHGQDALLLPNTDDPSAATEAVRRLLHDGDLRESIGRAGQVLAEQFTWDAIADRYADHYRLMLSSKR